MRQRFLLATVGFLDRMMQLANVKFLESEGDEKKSDAMYRLEEAHSDTFFPSRQARVLYRAPNTANYVPVGNFVRLFAAFTG